MADFSDNVPNPRDAGGDKMDRSLEEALRAYEEMPCKAQQINGLEYHRIIASYTMPLTCKGLVVCALPRPPFSPKEAGEVIYLDEKGNRYAFAGVALPDFRALSKKDRSAMATVALRPACGNSPIGEWMTVVRPEK